MDPVSEAPAIVEFGRFRVLPHRRELLADGQLIELGSRAFDVLMALIEARGALVSKDDILSRVWPGTVVEENNLQVQISALRKALGEDRDFIKTISGRGYRLVAKITAVAGEREAVSDRGTAFAAPLADARSLTNLPAAVTDLIGRDADLADVTNLVTAHRLVTLTGAGGIGKTRLGLEVARRLLPEFADGVWLAELAPLSDPDLVPVAVATALGLNLPGAVSPERVAEALGTKRPLLVLDNCEHVIDAAARMGETLLRANPAARVMATSREPLSAESECVYRVPPLDVPPQSIEDVEELLRHGAVRLFVARAHAADPHFLLDKRNAAAMAAICRRLDGIPLAIELAAARTAAFGVEALAARLDNRFGLLTGGRRTALPRHQTLRATLDWSHELLPEPERVVLRRLSIFAAGFALEAAGAVAASAEIAVSDVVDALANLVTKSLVTADLDSAMVRYRLLETTRAYALEKLAGSGEFDQVARRHAEYYRELFERAEAAWQTMPTVEWLAAYAPWLDNVRAALDWAFAPGGDTTTGLALTTASVPLWLQLSLLGECRAWVERALAGLDPGSGGSRQEMLLQAALGLSLSHTKGPVREVRAAWERVLELAEGLDDIEYQLRALYGLWLYAMHTGDYRTALAHARNFARVAGRKTSPADILTGDRLVGVALEYLGNHADARAHIQRVCDHYVRPLRRSRAVQFGFDQKVGGLIHLARILWFQGFPDQAMSAARASVAEATAVGHATSLCFALADAACPIAAWIGDLPAVARFGAMLIEHAGKHSLGVWHAYGTAWRSWASAKRGDPATVSVLRAALQGVRGTRFYMYYSMYLGWLAETLGAAQQVAESLAAIEEALHDSDELWCFPELLRIKGELVLLENRSNQAAAEDNFRQALDWARRQGALSWELRAATSLARLWQDRDRTEEATELLIPVYERFTEGFETADLKAAKALIDKLRPHCPGGSSSGRQVGTQRPLSKAGQWRP